MDLDTAYPAVSDLRARAKKRIPHFTFEYLDSGTGSEAGVRRNRAGLDAVKFRPAILAGTQTPNLSTEFLGRRYPLPFGIAPVGMSGLMWPGAERMLAQAASRLGIPYGMSTVATVTPETLAPHLGDQGWFQLYMPSDPGIRADVLNRAKAAGFHTLVLTVDVPVDSRRERQRRADIRLPPVLTPRILAQIAMRPRWALGTLREGPPRLRLAESYLPKGEAKGSSVAHAGHVIRGAPSWEDVNAIRELWDGPFLVKGVTKTADAKRLVKAGVDGIWVSNHSGRQFDGARASIEDLVEVRNAVPKAPVIFDSGIEGGLDIMRALALGADFVMLGRAFHYAVAALGAKGPDHLVNILKDDMILNMGQLGVQKLEDLKTALL